MRFQISLILLFTGVFTVVLATDFNKCKGEKTTQPIELSVSNCDKGTCILKRKSTIEITFKFSPETDVDELTTSVYGYISNVQIPFLGVHGTSACDKLFLEDGETKTNCPLKAGGVYVYKFTVPIYAVYPKVSVLITWALTQKDENIVCFEIPGKIEN